ncbi:NUDIX domain-containing protein [Halobaculum sp. WSA2]|uniref:NUDIX domain-containing protein n=1 Tax=Halobaculum saliterrae TaxID=2073113 RepID=A0A6B0SZB8_9EURY|nr:NUDIX domain-containing protein [Halobaculum saliterrae]MXR41913.1 NUDIX domain-containing protein [Halobaculum saliterrae]
MSDIRGVALGAVRHPDSGAYLVQRLSGTDDTHFHRFIGGGIESGESSDAALEREFREELGVDIDAGSTVCTVENLFEFAGDSHHEFAVVREATFVDDSLYDRDSYRGVDGDGGDGDEESRIEYEAYWRTLAELRAADAPFFPAGVADAVASDGHTHVVSPPEADAAAGGDGSDDT